MLSSMKALSKAWLMLIGWDEGTFRLERHLSSAFGLLVVVFSGLAGLLAVISLLAGLVSISATAWML